jgi:excisionase family DNA binding protein
MSVGDHVAQGSTMSNMVAFTPREPDPVPTLADPLFTVSQAAGAVQVSEDTVRRAYTAGHLKVERFGARLQCVRIRESELVRWMTAGGKTR